jgi:hypothetical protein
VVVCWEDSNELSDSIKGGEILEWLSDCWLLKKISASCS